MGSTCVLDNMVWHAAMGRQAALAKREGRAARFDADVSPFAALEDLSAPDAWDDLGRLVGEGGGAILFTPDVPVPDGWTREMAIPCLQMVATDVRVTPVEGPLTELGPADVDDMTALVDATRPGPFGPRTIELGRYVGLREDGKLVAMAGERFMAPGFTEISAVCTDPSVRGRGLGRVVVMDVLGKIRDRGEEAVLHVIDDNAPAIALYEALGFTVRTKAEAVVVRNTG